MKSNCARRSSIPICCKETGIDGILKYAASTLAQEDDNQIVDGLRNFLFGEPGQGGLDLASLNIQRGRDHGLADYNSVREAYGLARVTSFDQISSDPDVQQTLESLYGTVDNIDLWVGALSEDHARRRIGRRAGPDDHRRPVRAAPRRRPLLVPTRVLRPCAAPTSSKRRWPASSSATRRVSNLQGNVFFMTAEVNGQVYVDGNANGRRDCD